MRVSTEVMRVLSGLLVDGCEARISEQLDRGQYIAVNKVLEACGGKWNRKAKAHIFPCDAATVLDAVIIAGEVTTAPDIGFFPTPAPLAAQIVEMAGVNSGEFVLEPSAGTGRIVDALLAAGARVTAVERDEKMRGELLLMSDVDRGRLRVMDVEDIVAAFDDGWKWRRP